MKIHGMDIDLELVQDIVNKQITKKEIEEWEKQVDEILNEGVKRGIAIGELDKEEKKIYLIEGFRQGNLLLLLRLLMEYEEVTPICEHREVWCHVWSFIILKRIFESGLEFADDLDDNVLEMLHDIWLPDNLTEVLEMIRELYFTSADFIEDPKTIKMENIVEGIIRVMEVPYVTILSPCEEINDEK